MYFQDGFDQDQDLSELVTLNMTINSSDVGRVIGTYVNYDFIEECI